MQYCCLNVFYLKWLHPTYVSGQKAFGWWPRELWICGHGKGAWRGDFYPYFFSFTSVYHFFFWIFLQTWRRSSKRWFLSIFVLFTSALSLSLSLSLSLLIFLCLISHNVHLLDFLIKIYSLSFYFETRWRTFHRCDYLVVFHYNYISWFYVYFLSFF